MQRISVVDLIYVNSVSFSSILEIGDSKKITPVSQALAVQREVPLFFTNEGDFSQYPIFSRKLPIVKVTESVNMEIFNQNPVIKVNSIKVTGVSSAAVMQIGSTETIHTESKVKHIRKLLDDKSKTNR
ncbi:spore germination protein GerPE [Fredinandcohnia aciditolerans]|uniref:spore germination protein GerPE n=1 Tax=Ferdinandcohnia sp. SAFN-114 TaxID=3387275 RepID=UPI000EB20E76